MRSLKDKYALPDAAGKPEPEPEKPSKRMRQSTIWQSDECLRQLKALAAEKRTTISALVGIGLNHVFRQHNKPPIAIEEPDR